jgi:hypothetical protein
MGDYKSDIKKAITKNTKFVALKIIKQEYHHYYSGREAILIEIEIRKKKRNEK